MGGSFEPPDVLRTGRSFDFLAFCTIFSCKFCVFCQQTEILKHGIIHNVKREWRVPKRRKKLLGIENFLLTNPLRCDIMRVQKREKATVNTTAAHESDVRLSRQNLPRGVLLLRDINVNQQLPFAGRQRLIGWQKKFKLGIDKSQGLWYNIFIK